MTCRRCGTNTSTFGQKRPHSRVNPETFEDEGLGFGVARRGWKTILKLTFQRCGTNPSTLGQKRALPTKNPENNNLRDESLGFVPRQEGLPSGMSPKPQAINLALKLGGWETGVWEIRFRVIGLEDYSNVNIPAVWYKPVNFRPNMTPFSQYPVNPITLETGALASALRGG